MARYDQSWCDALAEALAAESDSETAPMRLVTVVADTDEGKVAFIIDLVGGAVSAVTAGKPPRGEKPDVTVTAKESVILEVWSGGRARDAAFMRGDLKVEGAYERWLDEVVPLFETEQGRAAWEAAAS